MGTQGIVGAGDPPPSPKAPPPTAAADPPAGGHTDPEGAGPGAGAGNDVHHPRATTAGFVEPALEAPEGPIEAAGTMCLRWALSAVAHLADRTERHSRSDDRAATRLRRRQRWAEDGSDDGGEDDGESATSSMSAVSFLGNDLRQMRLLDDDEILEMFYEAFEGECDWLFVGGVPESAADRPLHRMYQRMMPVFTEALLLSNPERDIQMRAGTAHGWRLIQLYAELFAIAAYPLGRRLWGPPGMRLRFVSGTPPGTPEVRADRWGAV